MSYNYLDALHRDVVAYIDSNIDFSKWKGDREGFKDYLNLVLPYNKDIISTESEWLADEYIAHNWELLEWALDYYDKLHDNVIAKGTQYCDQMIRLYLLPDVIEKVLDYYDFD